MPHVDTTADTVNDDAQALKPHPAAELFPLMSTADFDALVKDIKQNGLLEPIVTFNGTILDGRHRLRACQQLGIQPIVIEWTGSGTPEAFVISKNLHRRHLSESQRALIAKRLAKVEHGGDRRSDQAANLPLDQKASAKLLKVSPRSVRHAAAVIEKGAPELVAAVERGDIKVSLAAQVVDLPAAHQKAIAASAEPAKQARRAAKRMKRLDVISPPEVGALPKGEPRRVVMDADFQAEAEAAARDLEIERDERIALSGGTELAAENERLQKQIGMLDRRINALVEENRSLKYRVKMWRKNALAAGWKGRDDA